MVVQSLFAILDVLTSWLSKERARATKLLKLREREELVRKEGVRRGGQGPKEVSKENPREGPKEGNNGNSAESLSKSEG